MRESLVFVGSRGGELAAVTQWVLVRGGLPERHYTAASVAARDFKKAAKCGKKKKKKKTAEGGIELLHVSVVSCF